MPLNSARYRYDSYLDRITVDKLIRTSSVTAIEQTKYEEHRKIDVYDNTIPRCKSCKRRYNPVGQQKYCCQACREVAYYYRTQVTKPPHITPKMRKYLPRSA